MTDNGARTGSESAVIDARDNTAADYEDIPDMSDVDMSLVTWRIDGRVVSESEGRAAMADALAASRERVELDLPGDVVVAFRAEGPDWRERMAEALRKAAGL